jgi:transcriptional regulator with XRE-family HTH domain
VSRGNNSERKRGRKPKSHLSKEEREARSQRARRQRALAQQRPWGIADGILRERERKGLTIEKLRIETARVDLEKNGVSASHLRRIEKGLADPTLGDVYLITQALGVTLADISAEESWSVFSDQPKLIQLLDWVRSRQWGTKLSLPSRRYVDKLAHDFMVTKGVYRYVPLAMGLSDSSLQQKSIMEKYLFEIGSYQDEDSMERDSLDSHEGEEILVVMKGRCQLWLRVAHGKRPKTFELKEGDAVQYSSAIDHGYRSIDHPDSVEITIPPANRGDPERKERVALCLLIYTWRGRAPTQETISIHST